MLDNQAIMPGLDQRVGESPGLGWAGFLPWRLGLGQHRRIVQVNFRTDDAAVIAGEGLGQPNVGMEMHTMAAGGQAGSTRPLRVEIVECLSGAVEADYPHGIRVAQPAHENGLNLVKIPQTAY